jgi:cation diffusion facilitator family transporter
MDFVEPWKVGTKPAMNRRLQLAQATLVVGLVVFGLKLEAYFLTDSVALYSDALESLVNVGAALALIVSTWLASKPADANHPFGHTKAEYFSAVAEGVLIIVAAASILREAFLAIGTPRALEGVGPGLYFNIGATLINGAWATVLVVAGRRLRSPALTADSRHLFTDVATSVGVVVGVLVAVATGIELIDPIVAILVALNVLWTGWQVVRQSIGGLMDAAPSVAEVERIGTIISAHAEGAIEAHDLRTRIAGHLIFIEFHLVVPGTMAVSTSHDICDRIERAIREEFREARITIHVEPEEKAKHAGIVVMTARDPG